MIYLLDTDTLIYMIRGLKASARRQVRERARGLIERCRQAQQEGHAIGVSAITVSELDFGARKSGRYESESAAMAKILAPFEIYDYDAVSCPAALRPRPPRVGGGRANDRCHGLAHRGTCPRFGSHHGDQQPRAFPACTGSEGHRLALSCTPHRNALGRGTRKLCWR